MQGKQVDHHIDLVFENAAIVIADKVAGMLSVPSRMGEEDPRPCLGRLLELQVQTRLFPVHRLDLEVSGICLFAKDARTHKLLCDAWEKNQVSKVYEAYGEIPKIETEPLKPGTFKEVRSKLFRGKKRSFEAEHGKLAITRFRVVEVKPEHIVWRVEPITGRAHQIRVHCAKTFAPILGDTLYGSTKEWQPNAIALRAIELHLPEQLAKSLDIPKEFKTHGLA